LTIIEIQGYINSMRTAFSFLATFSIWLISIVLVIASALVFQSYRAKTHYQNTSNEVLAFESSQENAFYSTMPVSLNFNLSEEYYYQDIPYLTIKDYLTRHKSPMAESAEFLVDIARENELDPYLLVAIAQCESNLGKKMPVNCHNPFGWGIHSKGTLCFETWEIGYQKVAQGLREKYLQKGLNSIEEIMTKYNYDSWQDREGSWAKCVTKFVSELQQYNLNNL